jgi:hypothetical protein
MRLNYGGFMNLNLIATSALLLSFNAFAHTEYVGTLKGTNSPCVFQVEQTFYENNIESPENFRAEVAVNLDDGHGHQSGFTFLVKPSANLNIFSGLGVNQKDQINILVAANSKELESPVTVAIKWLHGNHFHTAQCINLKLADHE